jgi:quercetin dioxygenase-like cupin family protein
MTDRFLTEQPGITSWHCFSAGPHYAPSRLSFGPVVGVDEHLVAPGAGFDWHGHRGVRIVSWILDGTLRHEDSRGGERLVGAGSLLVQAAGGGIRHREWNASDTEPLRFVQITLLADDGPDVRLATPPIALAGVRVDVRPGGGVALGPAVVQSSSGSWWRLAAGDEVPLAAGADYVVVELGA